MSSWLKLKPVQVVNGCWGKGGSFSSVIWPLVSPPMSRKKHPIHANGNNCESMRGQVDRKGSVREEEGPKRIMAKCEYKQTICMYGWSCGKQLYIIYIWMLGGGAHVTFMCDSQRTTLGSCCFPTMLVLEIGLRSSGLVACAFTYWAISLTQEWFLKNLYSFLFLPYFEKKIPCPIYPSVHSGHTWSGTSDALNDWLTIYRTEVQLRGNTLSYQRPWVWSLGLQKSSKQTFIDPENKQTTVYLYWL